MYQTRTPIQTGCAPWLTQKYCDSSGLGKVTLMLPGRWYGIILYGDRVFSALILFPQRITTLSKDRFWIKNYSGLVKPLTGVLFFILNPGCIKVGRQMCSFTHGKSIPYCVLFMSSCYVTFSSISVLWATSSMQWQICRMVTRKR